MAPRKKRGQSAKQTRISAHRRIRMNEALDLRLQGFTYRQIAAAMNITVGTAHAYVKDALAEIPRDNAEAVLMQQLERYEAIVKANWDAVEAGDTFAAGTVMTAMRSIERLQGVDSPVLKDATEEVTDQLTELLEAATKAISK
jgi:3-deoxy-D-manno-octulosonic acid (KDO) 8-phosphate synthase